VKSRHIVNKSLLYGVIPDGGFPVRH